MDWIMRTYTIPLVTKILEKYYGKNKQDCPDFEKKK